MDNKIIMLHELQKKLDEDLLNMNETISNMQIIAKNIGEELDRRNDADKLKCATTNKIKCGYCFSYFFSQKL